MGFQGPSPAKKPVKRGNKVYNLYPGEYPTKAEAQKEVDLLERNGYKAIIVKRRGRFFGDWAVYARRATRKDHLGL